MRDRIIDGKMVDELERELPAVEPGEMPVERGTSGIVSNPTPAGVDRNGDGETYSNIEKREHGDDAVKDLLEAPRSRGRPPRIFNDNDLRQLDVLAAIQGTYEEIAAVLDVDPGWLSKNFSDRIAEKREAGKMSLRRKQFQKALVGEDTIMQIFLGKNILGQSDKKGVEHTGAGGGPIRHTHAHVTWNIGGRDLSFKE